MRSFSKDDRTIANDFNRVFTSVGQVAVDKIDSLANECNFDLSAPAFDPRIFPFTDQLNFMHVDCDLMKLLRLSSQCQLIRFLGLKKYQCV